LIISGFGSTLFSCLLLYDINQVTSSDNKIYFKEDFIIASINIYLDILNIFLYILQCIELGETAN
jgi:FtsH-binding integral membrane protein